MWLNNLESLLIELEQNFQIDLAQINCTSLIKQEISNLFSDIHEQLNRVTSTEKSYRHLIKTFIQPIPFSVAVLDRQMNYQVVSDRWITDYKLERDIIGKNHYEVFPEIPQSWRDSCESCLAGKIEISDWSEDFLIRENGRVDWLRWQLRSWREPNGQIGGVLIFSEIITEHKLLQKKIQSTEGQMRAVFAGMNEFVFTVELESDSILILPTKFFEIYDDSTVGRIIVQTQNLLFDSPESKASQALIRRVLRQQRAIEFEYSLQFDDALIWFSVNIFPISESSVIWIAKDITNRKEIERDILYAAFAVQKALFCCVVAQA